MELEVCTAASAQNIGRSLSKFLLELDNDSAGKSQPSGTPKKESTGKVSNALTNSGALGSSRERRPNNYSANINKNRNKGENETSKREQRSLHGAAFDRLRNTSNNNNIRSQHQFDNRGRGGSHRPPVNQSRGHNDRGRGRGRDDFGRGGGRGGRGHGGRGELRGGGRGGGGGRQSNMSGKRRQRDEEDFIRASAMDRGLQSTRRGDEPIRQGRDRDSRNNDHNHGKRARHEQASDNFEQQGGKIDDNAHSNHWQEGRGRRFSRGGGRFGRGRGRFSNTFYPNKQNVEQESGDGEADATNEAAAVSESPLVAGHFSVRGSFRGRGRGRGRGRFDGRGRAGRAQVSAMLSAKTWTRPRTMDEGLFTNR